MVTSIAHDETESETIYALASGSVPCAIAVVRVSGPAVENILRYVVGSVPVPRVAKLSRFRHPTNEEVIDRGLVIYFPLGSSYTGEALAEFHLHGSQPVIASLFGAFESFPKCRLADPGEFTKRAYLNGRMDLTEAEGLADLLNAHTESQRRQALATSIGSLSKRVAGWRGGLLDAMVEVEGLIDFAEDNELNLDPTLASLHVLERIMGEINDVLSTYRRGELIREGFTVLLAGPPNCGKSSFLNYLAGREVAIVTSVPGTTRDLIEIRLDLGGLEIVFVDTAGIRDTDDPVEKIGVQRALERSGSSNLVLWMNEPGLNSVPPTNFNDIPIFSVLTKADIRSPAGCAAQLQKSFIVSSKTGFGIHELLEAIQVFARGEIRPEDPAFVTNKRQGKCLSDAVDAIARAMNPIELPLVAEDLRLANQALASTIGVIGVEEVLGEIFSRFCIGK